MATHYEILGVSQDATEREIKTAYRTLARKHHPDKGGNAEEFQKINEAHEVLADRDERRKYDEKLSMNSSTVELTNSEPAGLLMPESPVPSASPVPASPEPAGLLISESSVPSASSIPAPGPAVSSVSSSLSASKPVRSPSQDALNHAKSSQLNGIKSAFYNGGKSVAKGLFDYLLPNARALDENEDRNKLITQFNLLLTRAALMVAMKMVSYAVRAVPQLYTQGKRVYQQLTEARDNPNASLKTKREAYKASLEYGKKVEKAEKAENKDSLKLGNDPVVDPAIARGPMYKTDQEFDPNKPELYNNKSDLQERLFSSRQQARSSFNDSLSKVNGRLSEVPDSILTKMVSLHDEYKKIEADEQKVWDKIDRLSKERSTTEKDWDLVIKETESIEQRYTKLNHKLRVVDEKIDSNLVQKEQKQQQINLAPSTEQQDSDADKEADKQEEAQRQEEQQIDEQAPKPEPEAVVEEEVEIAKDQEVKLTPMPDTSNTQVAMLETAEVSSRIEARQLERTKVEENQHPLAIELDNTSPTPMAPS